MSRANNIRTEKELPYVYFEYSLYEGNEFSMKHSANRLITTSRSSDKAADEINSNKRSSTVAIHDNKSQ